MASIHACMKGRIEFVCGCCILANCVCAAQVENISQIKYQNEIIIEKIDSHLQM